MELTRRHFLGAVGAGAMASTVAFGRERDLAAEFINSHAVLVDIPNCIGCRKCEYACQEADGANPPAIETFDDKSVLAQSRRPDPHSLTVINSYPGQKTDDQPLYAKVNCVHCLAPACASACLVGALRKRADGPVVYDPSKCMGCRYCMVACPFQIPTYEYDVALTPRVRKCSFCADRISKNGEVPACVKICPRECLTFGRRGELLALAREKIAREPDRYVDHIYGEHEAGGTGWLYLSSVPFERAGFVSGLGGTPPSRLTEAIQHGVFKYFIPPIGLYALLGIVMHLSRDREENPGDAEVARPNGARP